MCKSLLLHPSYISRYNSTSIRRLSDMGLIYQLDPWSDSRSRRIYPKRPFPRLVLPKPAGRRRAPDPKAEEAMPAITAKDRMDGVDEERGVGCTW